MESSDSSRGRGSGGSGYRGRSSSARRGWGSRFSASRRSDARDRKETENQNVEKNNDRAEKAKDLKTSIANERIDNVKEQGKKFINKIFGGFSTEDRGNIKVDIDDHFPTRISDVYSDSIEQHVYDEYSEEADADVAKNVFGQFNGMMHIATGIKLHKAAPILDRSYNKRITSINDPVVRLPERAATLIDQVGKTDIGNDNRIRIRNQNLAVKRQLVRGSLLYLNVKLKNFMSNFDKFDEFAQVVMNDKISVNMVDNSAHTLNKLKDIGKRMFIELSSKSYKFRISSSTYEFRIPEFEFKEENSLEDVVKYISNSIFTDFKFDGQNLDKIIGLLLLQVAPMYWIKNGDKKMKELDSTNFGSGLVSGVKFNDILNTAGIWNMNSYLSDDELDEIVGYILNDWNTARSVKLAKVIKMKEFRFGDFGSDAQMVEIDKVKYDKQTNQFGFNRRGFLGKQQSKVKIKISEMGSIYGLMARYTNNVEIKHGFDINFDGTNKNILREYLYGDFEFKKDR